MVRPALHGLMFSFAILVCLPGCGGARHTARCTGSPQVPCLTTEECTYDVVRDCESCRCAAPSAVPLQQNDPIAPAPE